MKNSKQGKPAYKPAYKEKKQPLQPIHKKSRAQKNLSSNFLPISASGMAARGWDQCDIIIISGDAYVDHSSFGTAVISRVLEHAGFRVGIIPQPRWDCTDDFSALGKPRCAFMVSSGNLDSMTAHYTAANKPRSEDQYSPGGKAGFRPDRALITYTSRLKQAYKDTPIILGGIEASLRRLSHYDYWSGKVRRSVLLDAKADLLIYGMAEKAVVQVCRELRKGVPIRDIRDIPGTLFFSPELPTESQESQESHRSHETQTSNDAREPNTAAEPSIQKHPTLIKLPSYEAVSRRDPKSNQGTAEGKRAFAESVQLRLLHNNPMKPETLAEPYCRGYIVQNPPADPLSTEEMDRIYELPFTGKAHPAYDSSGGIPALEEVRFSITSNRGCYGSCSFCAIHYHQGRIIQSRSGDSMEKEARKLSKDPAFKGYIHDVGGPTANFQKPACRKQLGSGPCEETMCLFPERCRAVEDDQMEYLSILRRLRSLPKVKKVFIRSGIRYDHLLAAPKAVRKTFMEELCRHHVSGQLRIAPEHISPRVLETMGKPKVQIYEEFVSLFKEISRKMGKEQYTIPYFISGHPGSTLQDAAELAVYLKHSGTIPEQAQDFYPTPGTVSTCMYYTGLDPRPGRNFTDVYVPRGREKRLQRALLQFNRRENYSLVREALEKAGRTDLIGDCPDCLISAHRHNPSGAGKTENHQVQSKQRGKRRISSSKKKNKKRTQ